MSREIILSERFPHVAIVDDEDYGYLVRWRWTFKVSSGRYHKKVYAQRNTWKGGKRIHVMLHDVVLERAVGPRPSPLHTAHHINTKSLDNRRENLEWATRSHQNKEAWKTRRQTNAKIRRPRPSSQDDGR